MDRIIDNDETLAQALGWRFSPAHDGWINDDHRQGDAYDVAEDVEEALFWSGIETDEDMRAAIDRIETRLAR